MNRTTTLEGSLHITIAGNRLEVTVDGGHRFGIDLQAGSNIEQMDEDTALSWAVLAGTPLASKVIGYRGTRQLPEDVRDALELLASFALHGEGHRRG